jgi:LPXTG-motif cell wall-anchored protein
LSGGVVVATITTVSTPTSALPSTGASPLTWTAAGIVLVLIAVGARYWRQSST